ncbi:N-terminal amidase Nta1 [Powellomyces hirtus]|nr:N-terminal amidase Nta1 [Powellomyces hirtus]
MKIACIQFAPKHGDPAHNRSLADALLSGDSRLQSRGSVHLIVLPEMAFSGYTFRDREHIFPYAELCDGTGETLQWAIRWARELRTHIQIGYPRRASNSSDNSDGSSGLGTAVALYNSISIVSPSGEILCTYDKHFLYETDEQWASEGSGFATVNIETLGKVGTGICMDLNPCQFKAPFEAFEFASYHSAQMSDVIAVSMAWILSAEEDDSSDPALLPPSPETPPTSDAVGQRRTNKGPVESTLRYWALRLIPIAEADRDVIFVTANRTGTEEGVTFCGSSCVMRFGKGQVTLLGALGRGEDGVLVVET